MIDSQESILKYIQNYSNNLNKDVLQIKELVDKLNEEEKQMNDFINKSLFSDELIHKKMQEVIINQEKKSKHQVK